MRAENPEGVEGDIAIEWGSDAMAELLGRLNLRYLALVPGSSYRGLHDSLVNYNGNRDPRLLVCLHEEHAVAIAHGYAKVTGRPMAAAIHSNVGLMHASMAIYNAWCDRVPMLIIGATGPVDAARRRPWIDWIHTSADQGALIRQYVKWDDQPASVEAALDSLAQAYSITRTAPSAPAYVCLDVILQEQPLPEPPPVPDVGRDRSPRSHGPDAEAVRTTLEFLGRARRPLFLFGRGSRDERDWDRRVALAERYGALVLSDLKHGAVFPTAHPLHPNPPGIFLPVASAELVGAADLILSLDWTDLAGTISAAAGHGHPATARIISCTTDSALCNGWSKDSFGREPVDLSVPADPDLLVRTLLESAGLESAGLESAGLESAGLESAGLESAGLDPAESANPAEWPATDATPAPSREPAPDSGDSIGMHDLAGALRDALAGAPACLVRLPLGVVAPAYVNVPLWVAQERGFLERRGLAATERILGTTHGVTNALRDGEVDIALTAPEGSIADAVAGGSLRVVAGLTDRPPLSMIALARHRTFSDLRGGRIGTSSLTEGTRHVAERMLAAHGLTYPADYDFALEGSHVERWKALQAGTIDAALQMIPYDDMAVEAGFTNLGPVTEEFALNAVCVRLPAERAVLTPFLRALADAAEWFGGNVAESAAIAAARTSIDPRYALRACQLLVDGEIIPRHLRSAPGALAAVIGAMRSSGLIPPTLPSGVGQDPIAAAVDYSYL